VSTESEPGAVEQPSSLPPIPLSPVEHIFWQHPIGTRVTVIVWLRGAVDGQSLRRALVRTARRQPRLRAGVGRDRRGGHAFHFADDAAPIPVDIVECGEGELPWREAVHDFMSWEFRSCGPLAAVKVLGSSNRERAVLLFSVHHAVADGASALGLVSTLLNEYAVVEADGAAADPPSALPLEVPRGRRTSWKSRWWLLRRFLNLRRQEKRSTTPFGAARPDVPPHSQWAHWVFSPDETLALIRRCRRERTSLNAAIIAAVSCSVAEYTRRVERLKWQVPFDVREQLRGDGWPAGADGIACCIATMNGIAAVAPGDSLWDVARAAHDDIQAFADHEGPLVLYNGAAALRGAMAANAVSLSSARRPDLLATNYGVVPLASAYGSLSVEGCTLTIKPGAGGPVVVAEALVIGQRLNLGLSADRQDPSLWEYLRAAVRRRFDDAIGERTLALPKEARL
jgi:hypothetical protein